MCSISFTATMRLASACLLITSVSALLVGCSLAPTKSVLEQQKAVAVYSWEAQGQMVFRCTYDERGFFWAFLYPQGKLLDDKGLASQHATAPS